MRGFCERGVTMEDIRFADIDSFSEEDKKRLAGMLAIARAESGLSQEAVALELGIAKKTVQNWEKGVSTPTLPQAIAWFRVMKVAAMPYLIQFMFPDIEMKKDNKKDKELLDSLKELIEVLPMEGVKQLLYLLYGEHGSSPRAVVNILAAYLLLPMKDRYQIDCAIWENYKMAEDMGLITSKDTASLDKEIIKIALEREREAILENKNSYLIL